MQNEKEKQYMLDVNEYHNCLADYKDAWFE